MFVIFIRMNFHGEGLPSGSFISLPQKQRWVLGFDVLGTSLTLLWLVFEVTGKNFQLAALTVLVPDICLSPYLLGSWVSYLLGVWDHLHWDDVASQQLGELISDPSCGAGHGFVTILEQSWCSHPWVSHQIIAWAILFLEIEWNRRDITLGKCSVSYGMWHQARVRTLGFFQDPVQLQPHHQVYVTFPQPASKLETLLLQLEIGSDFPWAFVSWYRSSFEAGGAEAVCASPNLSSIHQELTLPGLL